MEKHPYYKMDENLIDDVSVDILHQYMINLDYRSLQSACRVNKTLRDICADEYFWRIKVAHDFHEGIEMVNTWKQTWINLTKDYHIVVELEIRLREYGYPGEIVQRDITQDEVDYAGEHIINMFNHVMKDGENIFYVSKVTIENEERMVISSCDDEEEDEIIHYPAEEILIGELKYLHITFRPKMNSTKKAFFPVKLRDEILRLFVYNNVPISYGGEEIIEVCLPLDNFMTIFSFFKEENVYDLTKRSEI